MAITQAGGGRSRLPIGIDIGSSQIKAVEVEDTVDGVAVTAVGAVPTPPGSVVKGRVADVRAVSRAVRELISRGKFSSRRAALALGGEGVTLRWTQLPNLTAADLSAAARFEARKFLRHEADTMAVEAMRFEGATPEAETVRVLIAAAPEAAVAAHAEAVERAGLSAAAIEIEPLAVLRALMRSSGPRGLFWRDQSMAFVDIGASTLGMYVGRRWELRFARTVPGGEGGASEPNSERAAREISRLLSYYRSLFPERSYEGIIDRVTISGGGASTAGLAETLAKRIGIRIDVGNPFTHTVTKIDGATFATIDGRQPHFVVAMGLALGGIQETRWRSRTESVLGAAPDTDTGALEEAASA